VVIRTTGRGTNQSITSKSAAFFIQVLSAVKFMHLLKIAHRDLKMDNVVLCHGFSTAKLIDFGVAHRFTPGERNVAADKRIGTYPSPECYQEQRYSAFKNDVWALGFLLFMALAKAPPYEYPSVVDSAFEYVTSGSYKPAEERDKKKSLKALLKTKAMGKCLFMFTMDALDLLSKIFCPESERITVDEIFKHPWCSDEVGRMHESGELEFLNAWFEARTQGLLGDDDNDTDTMNVSAL